MSIRNALVRAVRTGLQAFAAGVPVVPVFKAVAGVKAAAISYGMAYGLALALGIGAFFTSFAQNLAEDNTGLKIPK